MDEQAWPDYQAKLMSLATLSRRKLQLSSMTCKENLIVIFSESAKVRTVYQAFNMYTGML